MHVCFINQSQFDRAEHVLGSQFQALEAQAMLGLEDFLAGHSGNAQLRVVQMYRIHASQGDWSMNDERGVWRSCNCSENCPRNTRTTHTCTRTKASCAEVMKEDVPFCMIVKQTAWEKEKPTLMTNVSTRSPCQLQWNSRYVTMISRDITSIIQCLRWCKTECAACTPCSSYTEENIHWPLFTM